MAGSVCYKAKNWFASLNCCKIDCQCLERLVSPSHSVSLFSAKSNRSSFHDPFAMVFLFYIEDKHKDEHRELYLLGLYVKDFENRLPFDSQEHDAFKNWLTDNKLSIGLKKQTRKSVTPAATAAGSKNVSRAASAALGIAFEDDEEAVAGAD